MDTATQDAIIRLMRDGSDFHRFITHVSSRRDTYLASLTTVELDLPSVARAQGLVLAFDEVLRMPEEAKNEKDMRTHA